MINQVLQEYPDITDGGAVRPRGLSCIGLDKARFCNLRSMEPYGPTTAGNLPLGIP